MPNENDLGAEAPERGNPGKTLALGDPLETQIERRQAAAQTAEIEELRCVITANTAAVAKLSATA